MTEEEQMRKLDEMFASIQPNSIPDPLPIPPNPISLPTDFAVTTDSNITWTTEPSTTNIIYGTNDLPIRLDLGGQLHPSDEGIGIIMNGVRDLYRSNAPTTYTVHELPTGTGGQVLSTVGSTSGWISTSSVRGDWRVHDVRQAQAEYERELALELARQRYSQDLGNIFKNPLKSKKQDNNYCIHTSLKLIKD